MYGPDTYELTAAGILKEDQTSQNPHRDAEDVFKSPLITEEYLQLIVFFFERGSLFFDDVASDGIPILQWMYLCPCNMGNTNWNL